MLIAQAVTLSANAAAQAIRDGLERLATSTGANRTVSATNTGANRNVGAVNNGTNRIVGAIWASGRANRPPPVQVTNVVQKYTTIQRTGSTSDSRNRSGPLEY